jgi:kynureninase
VDRDGDRARDDLTAELDAGDPLAGFRERFVVSDPGVVYLNGNSLGCLPLATVDRLREVVTGEWGAQLSRSWSTTWAELPARVGDLLASSVLGASADSVVLTDSTSVALYKLAWAALAARPGRDVIIADRDDFPTDRYVLEGVAAARGARIRWISADPVSGPTLSEISELLDSDVALVCLSHVGYRSSALVDAAAVSSLAHEHGALLLLDLSHSVGVVDIALDAGGVDLAVGCTYKYLSGGPGSPAFLYVNPSLQDELSQPIWGWWSHRDAMTMGPDYEKAGGISAFLSGTPGIIGIAGAEVGIRLVSEAGVSALRSKSVALTGFALSLYEDLLAPLGFTFGSPHESARRGAHVSFRHPDGRSLVERLAEAGVIADFRLPDSIRFGLAPLTTRFADVYEGCRRLAELAGGSG